MESQERVKNGLGRETGQQQERASTTIPRSRQYNGLSASLPSSMSNYRSAQQSNKLSSSLPPSSTVSREIGVGDRRRVSFSYVGTIPSEEKPPQSVMMSASERGPRRRTSFQSTDYNNKKPPKVASTSTTNSRMFRRSVMDRNFNNIEKSANEAIAAAEENARQIGVLKNIFVKKDEEEEEEESNGTKIRRNVSWGHLNEIVGVEKKNEMLQEGHNSTFGHDNNDQHNNYNNNNNNNDNNKNDEAQVGLTFKNAARLVSGMMSLSTKPPPGTYTSDGTGIQNMEVLDSDPSDFSEASSLNDEDIVSDSDEFVDAITRHHSCKGDMLELIQQMSFSDEEDSSDDDSKESITNDVENNIHSDDDDDDNDKVSEHSDEEDKESSANEVEFVKPRKMEPNKTTSFRRGKSKRGFLPNFFQSGSSRRFNLGLRNQNNNNSSLDMKDAASSTGGGGGDLDVDFPTRKRGGGSFRKNLNESFDEDSYVSSISSESSVSTVGFNESIFCDPELVTPLTFTSQEHNPILSYFDSHLWNIEITNSIQSDFLMEHSLFLRAAFQLLEERETFGVEANADDPNTIKTGPVKKKSSLRKGKVRIRWKIKYVEIRKGIFSYYEDTKASGGELHRKNIPLRSNLCTCRAVNNDPKPSLARNRNNGFMFELRNESGSTSLWMVNSAEERAAWIRSINEAMIGKQPVSPTNNNTNTKNTTAATSTSSTPTTPTTTTSTGGFGTSRLIPNLFVGNSSSSQYTGVYHEAYNEFDSIQKSVNRAKNKDAYLNSFFNLWGNSIKLPLQIFKEEGKSLSTVKKAMSPSTSQLWKLLGRGSYSINGHYLKGDVAYGPEKIIGALIRCILEYDRTEEDEEKDEGTEEIREKNKQEEENNKQNNNKSRANNNRKEEFITEVQAVSYAREILTLCCLASKWGDLYSCVSELMLSPHNLVILLPYDSQTTPIDINVSYYNPNSTLDEIGRENARNNMEKSDWLTTRIKLIRGWKKMFCVLSEGVLSFYEKEYPIPHGLKGQLILVGATIGVSEISQGNTGEGGNDGDCDVRNNNEGANSNQQASTPTRVRYIISILSKDRSKERQLFFNDKDKFNAWNEALTDAIRHCSTLETPREQGDEGQGGGEKKEDHTKSWGTAKSSDTTRKNKSVADMFRSAVNKVGVVGGINQTPPSSTSEPSEKLRDVFRSEIIDSKLKTFGRSTGLPKQQQQQQQEKKEFNPSDQTQNLQQQKPSVVITVEASTIYKICTSSPIGEELKDTWGMVRAKLTQSFYLSRGSNSRMYKGEEMLKMDFLKGYVQDTTFSMIFR